jgi:hypothetical protein
MGRKPKLTPHQIKEVRQHIAKDEKNRDLAASCGVNHSTVSSWRHDRLEKAHHVSRHRQRLSWDLWVVDSEAHF